jgi:hypothetical protein
MKKRNVFLTGILGMMLVFGLVLAGCGDSDSGGGGDDGGGIKVPTGVTLQADDSKITVSWNAITGATGYQVVWAGITTTPPNPLTGAYNSAPIPSGATTNYIINGLTNGDPYYVWVRAQDVDGNYSSYSAMKSATPEQWRDVPQKPIVGNTTMTDNGQLTVEWNATTGADSYEVYIGTSDDRNNAIARIPNLRNVLTYTTVLADNIANNGPYYVWVGARNAMDITWSDPKSGVTVIQAPLNADAFKNTTWKASVGYYQFQADGVHVDYFNSTGIAEGAGTFNYDAVLKDLTLTMTAAGGIHPEWTPDPNIAVRGKTFTISNIMYTRQ